MSDAGAEKDAPSGAKRLIRLAGTVISVASVAFFVWAVRDHLGAIADMHFGTGAVLGIVGGLVAHVLLIVVDGIGWGFLLRGVGESARLDEALGIFAVSQFAKYVPGNVAHHIGRVLLARDRGFDAVRVAMTLILEAAWAIGIGTVIALFSLLVARGGPLATGHEVPLWQVVLVGGVAFAGPPLGLTVLSRLAPSAIKNRLGGSLPPLPPFYTFAWYCLFAATSYACLGLGLDVLARGLFGTGSHFFLLSGVMTVAWLIGFLVPGAPAGLGVRELVLLALLGRIYDEQTAAQLTVWLRIVSSAADAVGFGGGLLLLKRPKLGQ